MAFEQEIDQNNQGNDNVVSAEDFLKNMNQDQNNNGPLEVPNEIGGMSTADFVKAYGSFVGNDQMTYQDLHNTLGYSGQIESLKKRNGSLQAQIDLDPFHDDLARESNKMRLAGANNQEVISFLQMQSIDVAGLSQKEAIILNEKLKFGNNRDSNLTDKDWNEWYNKTYGNAPDEDGNIADLTGPQKIELGNAANTAKSSLGQMKIDTAKPQAVADKERAKATFNSNFNFWGSVISGSVMNSETHKVTAKVKGADGKDSEVSYNYPLTQDTRSEITKRSAEWAASEGLGRTNTDLAKVKEYADRMIWGAFGPEILQNYASSLSSSTTEKVLQQQHNIHPINQNKRDEPMTQKQQDDQATMIAQIKAMGSGQLLG